MTAALALSTLVTRLARAAGVAAEHDEVLRRVDDLGVVGDERERLVAAAACAGLRAVGFTASVKGLRAQALAFPAVAPAVHSGERGFIAVLGHRRRGLDVCFDVIDVDGEVLTLGSAELARRTGVAVDEAIPWMALEPALPLDAVGHGHGHGHPSPFQRLRTLFRLERRDLVVIVAYGIVISLVTLATPLAVQALVSTVSFGTLLQPLVVLSVVLVLALVFAGALRALQLTVVETLVKRLFVRLVSDLAWRLPRVPVDATDDVDGAKLVNRFFDVLTVQKTASTLLLDGFALVLELLVALCVLAFYSDTLLAFSLLLFLAVLFVVFVLGRKGVATSIDESVAKHDVAGWLEDLVRHPTAFRTATTRAFGLARIEAFTREYLAARSLHFAVLLRQSIASFALQATAAAALLGVGGALVLAGELTLGQLVAAELIVGSVVAGLAKLGKHLEAAYDLFAAVDKIGHLVDLDVERNDGAPVRPDGSFGFAAFDLEVAAGDRSLHFGSFSVEEGAAVAVRGDSGSGKTLLVDVLLGLRTPSAGRVSVDGDDVRTLSLQHLRARIGVARSDEIFEGTVAENLRVGREGIVNRALVEALRLVELDDDVLAHKDGLGRVLVPGRGLSSGQARRLMIARASLGEPGLLVLDGVLDGLPLDLATRIVGRLRKRPTTLVVLTARHDLARLLPRRLHIAGVGVSVDSDQKSGSTGEER